MGPRANPLWPAGIIPMGESTCEVVSTESKNNGFGTMAWRNKSIATVRIGIFSFISFSWEERGNRRGGGRLTEGYGGSSDEKKDFGGILLIFSFRLHLVFSLLGTILYGVSFYGY